MARKTPDYPKQVFLEFILVFSILFIFSLTTVLLAGKSNLLVNVSSQQLDQPPIPKICDSIKNSVPQQVITEALANPEKIPGWNQLVDPGKPEGPNNPRKINLEIENIALVFNAKNNSLKFKPKCDSGLNTYEKKCGCNENKTCNWNCGVYNTVNSVCQIDSDCIGSRNQIVIDIDADIIPKDDRILIQLHKKAGDNWNKIKQQIISPGNDKTFNYIFNDLPLDSSIKYMTDISLIDKDNRPVEYKYFIERQFCSNNKYWEYHCYNITAPGYVSYKIRTDDPQEFKRRCQLDIYGDCIYQASDNKCYSGYCNNPEKKCLYGKNCIPFDNKKYYPDPRYGSVCFNVTGETVNQPLNCPALPPPPVKKTSERKIFLLINNPYLKSLDKYYLDAFDRNEPFTMATQVADTINSIRGNFAQYKIINSEGTIRKTFPPLADNYDPDKYEKEFIGCAKATNADNPDCVALNSHLVDWNKLFDQYQICEKVNKGEIDEVWAAWQGHTFVGEDDMIGPKPYGINGRIIYNDKCKRNIPTLSLDLTTGYDQAVHSFGHRIESTLTLVYKRWNWPDIIHPWDAFARTRYHWGSQLTTNPPFGCGDVQYGLTYDIDKDRGSVPSYCDQFFHYPDVDMTKTKDFDCRYWGCSQQGFLTWWMDHLPSVDGKDSKDIYNNWWQYINNPELAAPTYYFPPIADIPPIFSDEFKKYFNFERHYLGSTSEQDGSIFAVDWLNDRRLIVGRGYLANVLMSIQQKDNTWKNYGHPLFSSDCKFNSYNTLKYNNKDDTAWIAAKYQCPNQSQGSFITQFKVKDEKYIKTLDKFDNVKFNDIYDLIIDNNNIIWAIVDNKILRINADGSMKMYDKSSGINSEELNSLVLTADNRLYIGSGDLYLYRYDRLKDRWVNIDLIKYTAPENPTTRSSYKIPSLLSVGNNVYIIVELNQNPRFLFKMDNNETIVDTDLARYLYTSSGSLKNTAIDKDNIMWSNSIENELLLTDLTKEKHIFKFNLANLLAPDQYMGIAIYTAVKDNEFVVGFNSSLLYKFIKK